MPIRPALLLLAAVPSAVAAAPIEVAVTNVTQAKGRVHVDICSQKLFMGSDCLYSGEAPAVIGTTIVTIPNGFSGRVVAPPISEIEREEVFEARMQWPGVTASSSS